MEYKKVIKNVRITSRKNKIGTQSTAVDLNLPMAFVRLMGLNEDEKSVIISYDGTKEEMKIKKA